MDFSTFLIFFGYHSDTPHHLKNKRVQQSTLANDAVSVLLANAPKPSDYIPTSTPDIINIQPNPENDDANNVTNHMNDCGKFDMIYDSFFWNSHGCSIVKEMTWKCKVKWNRGTFRLKIGFLSISVFA